MNMIPDEQRKAQQDAGKDDLVQYVEELANVEEYPEGDTWISLTDAARITRTSEAMARRWVTSGRLPTKKEPVGIPPRTRLVRLSDVAKIRPIIDPTAAVSDEVRKLDLPSIPRQQLQIMEDHQRLLQQGQADLEQVMARFRELADGQEKFAEEQQQVRDSLTKQSIAYSQGLQQARQDLNALVVETEKTLRQALSGQIGQSEAALRQALESVRKVSEEEIEKVRLKVADLAAAIWGAFEELQAAVFRLDAHTDQQFSQVASRLEPLETTLSQQQEALATLRRDMMALVEQQVREVFTALEQLARDQAQDVAMQNERLETIEKRMEQVSTRAETAQIAALGAQKRADEQDQRLQEVRKILQGEVAARQALEQRLNKPSTRSKRPT